LEAFSLLFRKHFLQQIEKNRISFVVVAHAWHTPLRASVSTWEGFDLQILVCRCVASVARDRIERTCRLVWGVAWLEVWTRWGKA